ncbi:Hypothetical protein R9X50_00683600 [Acrodontium crateriforme]|uniref:ABC transporter TMD0 domain-containing protein n=1 Tax=Acrodontium crateriforme TaxID=150365 RepID=A0AAQ3MBL0_9PEZI|nr:Hypothetical protein R9X50_00683600 [Acrodontium crateriforme]
MLCTNRPEGFGPHSTLSSPIPTTCFVDVILIPLPVWLAIVAVPILLFIPTPSRKSIYSDSPTRSWLYKTALVIYYILIVCNILMQTLEIVRLSLIHYGIGLLPFTYVGLILGATLHRTRGLGNRIRFWKVVNLIVWIGLMVMSIVKVVGLDKEGIDGRKGSKYMVSDQVIDVGVMAGVYAVIAVLELILGF